METSASSSASSSAAKPALSASQVEALRLLPEEARAAFARFQADGDLAALDLVIMAIIEDFVPRPPPGPFAALPGETRLMKDLGFDSLAIAEVVFFTEDLLGICIDNEEILQVSTLDDLRGFVRRKAAARPVN